jgi:putative Mg2+ transporter-C (MgtC) family protein
LEWSISPDIITKVLLALLLGGAVGLEREIHGRSAGLRTHILVCLGAALVMIVGRQISFGASHDTGRVAAGVVTGVGFLGAGVIIRMERGIRGLTTAACLWLVAALGITVGMDLYGVAVMATVIAITVLFGLSKLERLLPEIQRRQVEVALKGSPVGAAGVIDILKSSGCRIVATSLQYDGQADITQYEFVVKIREKEDPALLVNKIASLEEVTKVTWR